LIKMNKLVIPTILAFSVLIAGVFALMPINNAYTVHNDIIAAITGSQDVILLDLEDKIKLSSDSDGPTAPSTGDQALSTINIRALDGGQPTTFNLKECYLTGTSNNSGNDNIFVSTVNLDSKPIFTGENKAFTNFGPRASGAGTTTVELLSGLGFTTGLGADDTILIVIQADAGEIINDITCIAFVQNSADFVVTVTNPVD